MVNKKGWIRIVEASIAILIILGVILTVVQIRKSTTRSSELSSDITALLDEIAKNATMRDKIITDNTASTEAEGMIKAFLAREIRDPSIGYGVVICQSDALCALDPYPEGISGNLYAGSRIISSSLRETGSGPKRVSIFLWRIG